MDTEEDISLLEQAETAATSDANVAIDLYFQIVRQDVDATDKKAVKDKERAILQLCELLSRRNDANGLRELIKQVRPFLGDVSKAKGGKLFKELIDRFVELTSATAEEKVAMCKECIEWAKENKRQFLRQALEVRLSALHLDAHEYQACLREVAPLLVELKRLDDRQLLVDVHLMESRACFALGNFPKSRAALVAARTTANAIYCPPRMQAALDLQSGILHAQERDYKTGYSYYYEAFEGFDSVESTTQAVRSLKYMLLMKILMTEAADVPSIITGKLALKYAGRDLEALQAVASASLARSLADFEKALKDYSEELQSDAIIQNHIQSLYDSLLQLNLNRIVEPFSRVEISHVASIISLPLETVERKLSQMILDQTLTGILDQGAGCLEIFEPATTDKTYDSALDTIVQTGSVVDSLYKKARKLF